jgi:hypothetical protein
VCSQVKKQKRRKKKMNTTASSPPSPAPWVTALVNQAQANEDAEDSADIVINGIASQISTAVANATGLSDADKATLQGLAAQLKAHSDPLSAAIVANTPAAPDATDTAGSTG